MDILKFSLKGKTAFFKKPEVNTYFSFTYGNIHKVALLGIFGAIRGYGGYASMDAKKDTYPEFFDRLKELRCSIVPKNENGFIKKKMQQFNNSVGYASGEQGGNLIVKEQWLENPSWDVYVLIDCDEAKKLADFMVARKCIYIPYLGKNDHPADILDVTLIEKCELIGSFIRIDSLFLREKAVLGDIDDFEEEYCEVKEFKYEEYLPVGLNEDTNMYELKAFVHSNLPVKSYEDDIYRISDSVIAFF
ncbi:MAG TPA: type I-B CRISPR-associated protein Cas5 [Clostridiales bacterium]|nr:type I-B CRISPR-associated protein Cas5 [Clostridiales bacterium]